jgi:hypothetical protein
MNSFKKLCLLGAALVIAAPLYAFAQATTTQQAQLIADVNVTGHTLKITDGAISGTFTAMSNFGNQDAVHYGFVMRSKSSGALIDASAILGTLSLVEKVPTNQAINYKLPSLRETGIVYLNLSNASGIILASVSVEEISGATAKQICTISDAEATCKATAASTLNVTVNDGGAQGKVLGTTSLDLPANQSVIASFADLMKNFDGGQYLISGVVTTAGQETERFVKEYTKAGPRAKILSVSIPPVTGQAGSFKATVYTGISGFASTTTFTLGMNAGSCGDAGQTAVAKGNVTELALTTTCANGTATVTLYENGAPVDTAVSSFSLPSGTAAPVVTKTNLGETAKMIGAGILALALIAFLIMRRRGASAVPPVPQPTTPNVTPTTTPMPSTTPAPAGAVAALVLMFAMFASFTPTNASAATYAIDGEALYLFCNAGGGCADVEIEFPTSGVVTVPATATVGTAYSATVTQQSNAVGLGTSASWVHCIDAASDTNGCDSLDVQTTVYSNGAYADTLLPHVASRTYSMTAPSTPGTQTFGFYQVPAALYRFGCNPTYVTPTAKCTGGLTSTTRTFNISFTAAPVVDVHFSFLQKMFSVFALN